MSCFLSFIAVTFTLTLSIWASLMSGGWEGLSVVHWEPIWRIELRWRRIGGRSSSRISVHVPHIVVRTWYGPLAWTWSWPGVSATAALLLRQISVVVIHLVDRRISAPCPTLPTPIVFVRRWSGDWDYVRRAGRAGPCVGAHRGAGPRYPQLLSGKVQWRTCLLTALLWLSVRFGWKTLAVGQIGCGGWPLIRVFIVRARSGSEYGE